MPKSYFSRDEGVSRRDSSFVDFSKSRSVTNSPDSKSIKRKANTPAVQQIAQNSLGAGCSKSSGVPTGSSVKSIKEMDITEAALQLFAHNSAAVGCSSSKPREVSSAPENRPSAAEQLLAHYASAVGSSKSKDVPSGPIPGNSNSMQREENRPSTTVEVEQIDHSSTFVSSLKPRIPTKDNKSTEKDVADPEALRLFAQNYLQSLIGMPASSNNSPFVADPRKSMKREAGGTTSSAVHSMAQSSSSQYPAGISPRSKDQTVTAAALKSMKGEKNGASTAVKPADHGSSDSSLKSKADPRGPVKNLKNKRVKEHLPNADGGSADEREAECPIKRVKLIETVATKAGTVRRALVTWEDSYAYDLDESGSDGTWGKKVVVVGPTLESQKRGSSLAESNIIIRTYAANETQPDERNFHQQKVYPYAYLKSHFSEELLEFFEKHVQVHYHKKEEKGKEGKKEEEKDDQEEETEEREEDIVVY